MPSHSKRRGKGASANAAASDVSAECLCLSLHLCSSSSSSTSQHQQLQQEVEESCPVPLQQLEEGQHATTLQLESWSQLPAVLQWFGGTVLQAHPAAKLSFPPCLPKDVRADVHTCVSKKCPSSKLCQSVSEGLGEQRYVAVVAKGSVKPASRRMTGEQQDHAMALWLLWKQHSKQAAKQQQQQVPPPAQEQQQHPADAASDGLQSLTLLDADCEAAGTTASADSSSSSRVYSRDEVGQMLVQDSLTDELAALWRGPQGVQQRAVRLLCLAAAAGDVQEVQELAAAHPELLPSAVADLSAGGSLPLHLAAAGGCVQTVQALLAAGAPLEAKDGKGQTALQVAQRSEQCDVEAVLMQAGAVNTQKDSWGTLDMPGGFL